MWRTTETDHMIMRHSTAGEDRRQLEASKTKWHCEREKKGSERGKGRESSSNPHVSTLLGKTGMLQDEKQMWRGGGGEKEKRGGVGGGQVDDEINNWQGPVKVTGIYFSHLLQLTHTLFTSHFRRNRVFAKSIWDFTSVFHVEHYTFN